MCSMQANVRLSQEEREAIVSVLCAEDSEGKVYVFGSRADVNKRGGDIDIFFQTSKKLTLRERLFLEYRLRAECDTKIDLLVKSADEPNQPIYDIAREGVLL